MWFALPLPILLYKFLPQVKPRSAVHFAYLPDDAAQTPRHTWPMRILLSLLWFSLVCASARPVWYGEPQRIQPKHRDLMLVVDLSYSMSQEDMQSDDGYIDRLSATKHVVSDFISQRQGDRLGLVLFADHAYLQTPLTFDLQTVQAQLKRAGLKMIGTNTAIGEGIGLATKTFIDDNAPQRIMILLSDGSNTSGVLDPIKAANIAAKYHAKIYTIGIGAGEVQVKDFFMTRTINTAKDLDEKTLTEIAKITGGKYFRARNAKELANIYDEINRLEPVKQADQVWRPQQEWFIYPLTVSFFLSLLLLIWRRHDV